MPKSAVYKECRQDRPGGEAGGCRFRRARRADPGRSWARRGGAFAIPNLVKLRAVSSGRPPRRASGPNPFRARAEMIGREGQARQREGQAGPRPQKPQGSQGRVEPPVGSAIPLSLTCDAGPSPGPISRPAKRASRSSRRGNGSAHRASLSASRRGIIQHESCLVHADVREVPGAAGAASRISAVCSPAASWVRGSARGRCPGGARRVHREVGQVGAVAEVGQRRDTPHQHGLDPPSARGQAWASMAAMRSGRSTGRRWPASSGRAGPRTPRRSGRARAHRSRS